MSVLRHGGSYLQRRLTKMYTDTKTSCESVTTASKANDDPELVALHRNYRTQKDRLLAWGLDWSDSSAAQPNDIDESLTEAGFSDVVASVMSSIQEILNEAERLQHIEAPNLPPRRNLGDFPSKDDLSHIPIKAHWTEEDIKRSYSLLNDLTACIDTLYDLSQSRRNMGMGMSSSEQTGIKVKSRSQTTGPKASKPAVDQSRSMSVDSKSMLAGKGMQGSPVEMKSRMSSPKQERVEFSPFSSLHVNPATFQDRPHVERTLTESFAATKHLFIDRSALQLSGASHAKSPPPYEQVAASANSRIIGRIQTSATPFLTGLTKESTIPILVEFTPMMLESQNSITIPAGNRLESLHRSLDQLVENSRVSHLGLLRFLGYYIDMANARYAFVYQMPIDYFPFLSNPSNLLKELKPKTLVSLFSSGDEHSDIPVPTLESRFRLAYNLLLAALHLRSRNVVHGSINSSNILVFPGLNNSSQDEIGSLTEDLRHPYLTSMAQFSGNEPSPEPLSSSMYRHPDDKRLLDEDTAWSYDLYSLGLVLLEIGLWTPISRLWKMKYDNAMFKQRIENVYIQKLASKCGNAYLHVVQLCLDAPNFVLSTEPMADLGLRVPQVYTYPTLEMAEPSSFVFSANFLFTMSKIIHRCCAIDIFSPPPNEDLGECLPLAFGQDFEAIPTSVFSNIRETGNPEVVMEPAQSDETAFGSVKMPNEKKVKKRTFRKLTNVEIPQEHLNQWNFVMLPRLSKLLQKILRDSSESCSATLMMTGETPNTAKTTICVTCSNVRKVRATLKKYFEIEQDWDMIVIRGDVTRSKVPKRGRRKPQTPGPVNSNEPAFSHSDLNPNYQQKPLCGASIGAFRNEEHLPPVSYGGAILVDDMPFGMTVHHMLEAPSEDEDEDDEDNDAGAQRSSANWGGDMAATSTDFSYSWCDDDPATNYELEITDDEDETQSISQDLGDYWLSDDESSDDEWFDPKDAYDDEDAASIGDTAGIDPDEEPRLVVTQPAIDDVHEDFFPTLEDRDDEHLASHTLGYVHASSGLRRWTRKGMKHEIDWALIQLDEGRMDARNVILPRNIPRQRQAHNERSVPEAPVQLNKVAGLEELGGLKVHCCGRTSGLQSGQISRAMTLVKLYGRQTFSTSFCVDGNFGVPGDSGAWVFDKSTGRVCGHVLAWSDKSRTAYIAPMQVLLEDIARTLGASWVTLPGCRDDRLATARQHSAGIEAYHQRRQRREVPVMPEEFPIDIGRLNVGNFDDATPLSRMVGSGRGLRDVSTSYHAGPPLMTRSGGMERQLA